MRGNQRAFSVRMGAPRLEHAAYIMLDLGLAIGLGTYAAIQRWTLFLLVPAAAFGLIGIALLVRFATSWRLPLLRMDRAGVTVRSFGTTWHCPWTGVLWIDYMSGLAHWPGRHLLVAKLGPEAPPVAAAPDHLPVPIPGTDTVMLFDLTELTRDPAEAIAAVRRFSGGRWGRGRGRT